MNLGDIQAINVSFPIRPCSEFSEISDQCPFSPLNDHTGNVSPSSTTMSNGMTIFPDINYEYITELDESNHSPTSREAQDCMLCSYDSPGL